VILARAELGRWPTPMQPDPKSLSFPTADTHMESIMGLAIFSLSLLLPSVAADGLHQSAGDPGDSQAFDRPAHFTMASAPCCVVFRSRQLRELVFGLNCGASLRSHTVNSPLGLWLALACELGKAHPPIL
jgi:hypothetical protein